MKQPRRRATYQYGTLSIETRSRGPNVWAYRCFERVNGKKLRREAIIGTLEQFPAQAVAEVVGVPTARDQTACSKSSLPEHWYSNEKYLFHLCGRICRFHVVVWVCACNVVHPS